MSLYYPDNIFLQERYVGERYWRAAYCLLKKTLATFSSPALVSFNTNLDPGIFTMDSEDMVAPQMVTSIMHTSLDISNDGKLVLFGIPDVGGGEGKVFICGWADNTLSTHQVLSSNTFGINGSHFGLSVFLSEAQNRIVVGSPNGGTLETYPEHHPHPTGNTYIFDRGIASDDWHISTMRPYNGRTANPPDLQPHSRQGTQVYIDDDGDRLVINGRRVGTYPKLARYGTYNQGWLMQPVFNDAQEFLESSATQMYNTWPSTPGLLYGNPSVIEGLTIAVHRSSVNVGGVFILGTDYNHAWVGSIVTLQRSPNNPDLAVVAVAIATEGIVHMRLIDHIIGSSIDLPDIPLDSTAASISISWSISDKIRVLISGSTMADSNLIWPIPLDLYAQSSDTDPFQDDNPLVIDGLPDIDEPSLTVPAYIHLMESNVPITPTGGITAWEIYRPDLLLPLLGPTVYSITSKISQDGSAAAVIVSAQNAPTDTQVVSIPHYIRFS